MNVKRNNRILYLLTVLFFGVFYYFLPFAGDDWAWGSALGMERLKNAFEGYNGRYIGNLLIILITRSVTAKVIICTLTMFLLIWVLSRIFDGLSGVRNSAANYIIAFSSVLVLVLPNQIAFGELQPFQIFGSTVGWLSGFTNYVVPAVLILLFYYAVTTNAFNSVPVYVLLALDGVLACLCVEHYSLFCLLFAFGVIVYRFCFCRKICKKSVAFLCGSFVGTLIMFSNSSYRLMQKGDARAHQRAVGFFGSLKQYAAFIFPKNADKTLVTVFEIVLLLVIVSVLVFFFLKAFRAVKSRTVKALLPMICLVVMTLPLLFTNSGKEIYIVAPRCYFLQYFMLVIYFYGRFARKKTAEKASLSGAPGKGLVIGFAVLLLVTGVLYCRLDYRGMVRDNTVNQALEKDASTVEIIQYPKSIEHIQWSSNFIKQDTYLKRYISFKNIPESKEVTVVTEQNE